LKQALLPAAFAACCVPLLWLAFQFFTGGLGANPIEALLNDLGYTAFVLLALTLACTPAQVLLGWKWPIRIRKLLGDFCFFYACLHLLTYTVLDQGFDLGGIVTDVLKHRFI
jgi:sulfoxide reductase heme-binding subunit YedZ